ncbi:MAG TPA: hypothetical protein DCP47_02720 [Phycisphaerales bacterium]|nr:hypothetical protein [Phycisphaerales bacterium]
MGDTILHFKALRIERQKKKKMSLQKAIEGIDVTDESCGENLRFIRYSEYHYRIVHKNLGWMIDIWPSTQRLRSVGKVRAPFLPIATPWTIKDVLEAANTYELQREISV